MATIYDKGIAYKNFNGDIWYRNFPNNSGTTTSTEPLPGEAGWGCGVYPGDDLEDTLGLIPMEGCDNPNSDNYGNYQNADGSVFCFIPKYYYSFDCKTTDPHYQDVLTYSKLTAEQVAEIVNRSPNNYFVIAPGSAFTNEEEANAHGFILHRAFIDGGVEKSGFFIMKYLASKGINGSEESTKALSIKNGSIISLANTPFSSSTMPNCKGISLDAITLSKAINHNLNCASSFMYSALVMQSKFIGTIATSTSQCAWYDSTLQYNYPKGCNYLLKSVYDETVTFTKQYGDHLCLAGSGTPFNKTTHNGLANGVADIVGCRSQHSMGMLINSTNIYVFNENIALSDITTDSVISADTSDIYNSSTLPFTYYENPLLYTSFKYLAWFCISSVSYNNKSASTVWIKEPNGLGRAIEGILPLSFMKDLETFKLLEYEKQDSLYPSEDTKEFNNSVCWAGIYKDEPLNSNKYCVFSRYVINSTVPFFSNGEFFSTYFLSTWDTAGSVDLPTDGFRAAGYAS